MRRRSFIKNIGFVSVTAGLAPAIGTIAREDSQHFRQIEHLTLKEYKDEHEEYPCLASDKAGNSWLFSLRRLPYPENKEIISAFHYTGTSWQEISPVTKASGQYEYPTAACAVGGSPVVAWSRYINNQWCIEIAIGNKDAFFQPKMFRPASGKYLRPVLFAASANKTWLAWEKYENGRFSICIAKNENGSWNDPIDISDNHENLFDPTITEDHDGHIYLAHGITSGVHQNIEMKIIDSNTLSIIEKVPIAIGGGLKDRVNMNTHPALAADKMGRIWISWENNRKTHRLEDGDNFTGDRICAMVCYDHGVLKESAKTGKWLFDGKNDHLPTFVKDDNDELYVSTHCGGDFVGNPFWKYRVSKLDVEVGWSEPEILLETRQKGQTHRPALIINSEKGCWLSTRPEKWFEDSSEMLDEDQKRARLSKLDLHHFELKNSRINAGNNPSKLIPTTVNELLPQGDYVPTISGRKKKERKTVKYDGETYTLLMGNLHEHTEISSCWPAGCDGTIHDDYRFGMFSEGYDFMGITDHGYSLNEVYWRKSLRMANFYTDGKHFVAIPSLEWTLSNGRGNIEIKPGAGHKNIIFASEEEALKFIKNKDEIYSIRNGETKDAMALWKFLNKNSIDCITIPHHPADEVHATDWDAHDAKYQPIVEIFQCRGNAEYPGCPREINVTRHKPIPNKKAYIDYALSEKKYRMGFIASGDHNSIGVGTAAIWVKEINSNGVLEALKNRRCFATTGDKLYIDLKVNGAWANTEAKIKKSAKIAYEVEATDEIKSIELLRNSQVIKIIDPDGGLAQKGELVDENLSATDASPYYYLRVTQKNGHIAGQVQYGQLLAKNSLLLDCNLIRNRRDRFDHLQKIVNGQ